MCSVPRVVRFLVCCCPSASSSAAPGEAAGRAFPWIHIVDEVAVIRFAIQNEAVHGPLNAVAPHPLTNAEFSRVLGRVMGRPAFIPVPAFGLRLLFGDGAGLLLQGQMAIPRRLLDMGFTFRFPEAEAALRDVLP